MNKHLNAAEAGPVTSEQLAVLKAAAAKRGNAWINLMASDLTLATFHDFESAIAWLGGGHD